MSRNFGIVISSNNFIAYKNTLMTETNDLPILWYFADPMCSWCWGFSPAIIKAKGKYSEQVRFSLNLGGLRPGTTEPISDSMREEILHHWRDVNRLSGQPFEFDHAMPDGFIYDTEPASRAVLAFGKIDSGSTLDYFSAIQSAFYAQGRDVTQTEILTELAVEFGVESDKFQSLFASNEMRTMVQQHFQRTRQAGVRGFPTVIWQQDEKIDILSNGYVPYEMLIENIDNKLKVAP